MNFKNRTEAGRLLSEQLNKYKDKEVVVYGLPRGGVVVAVEIAKALRAPLDLIIPRKIGHPNRPEYAIAAVAENGHIVGEQNELMSIDEKWLREEIDRQRNEAKRRREKYLHGKAKISVEGKIAVIVDDGTATGLTMRVGIMELKHRRPMKIIVAVPVILETIADLLRKETGEKVVSLNIVPDDAFLGSVGAYYNEFYQVDDAEVMSALKAVENFS